MLNAIKEKISLPEFILLLMYAVFLIVTVLQATQFVAGGEMQTEIKYIRYLILAGLIVSFLCSHELSMRKILFAAAILIMSVLTGRGNQDFTSSMLLGMFIVCGINMHTKYFLKVYCVTVTAVCLITVLLVTSNVYTNDFLTETARSIRYYLGFDYTTTLPNYFLHVVIAWFAADEGRINILKTIIILIINQILMYYTGTRAVYYLVILFLILVWLLNTDLQLLKTKTVRILSVLLMPFLCVFIFSATINYSEKSTTLVKINDALSGRLEFSQNAVEKYGFEPFGEVVEFNTGRDDIDRVGDYLFVDSSYIYDAMVYGIIPTVLVVLAFSAMIYKSHKDKQYFLWLALIFIAIHAFTDFQLMRLDYNPFMLLIYGMLFRKDKQQIE